MKLIEKAIKSFNQIKENYPIILTRDLKKAKRIKFFI